VQISSGDTSKIKSRNPRKRTPRHPSVARSYRFRLDVSPEQSVKLHAYLDSCHALRNRLAADRLHNRDWCKEQKRQGVEKPQYLNRSTQYEAVSLYAQTNEPWSNLHSQVRQNIACRVDEGYKRFFDARKEGRPNVSPPKEIERKKYRSFTFPQYGTASFLRKGKVYLSGLGEFAVRDHRKVHGLKKTVTVKWMHGHWWVVIVAMVQAKDVFEAIPANDTRLNVGCDPGLTTLLATSHGETFDPPRALKDAQKQLASAQKKMSRQFEMRKKLHAELVISNRASGVKTPPLRETPYSKRLKSQITVVAKLHTRVFNVRDYHHKKIASVLASKYNKVAVEEHGLNFMIRNSRLAKSASDRAIGGMKLLMQSKLGDRYIKTPNQRPGIGGNSQSCICEATVKKELQERTHACPSCGLIADRDHVSANVVQLIAFGTTSDSLASHYGCPGRTSSDVESAKDTLAKAIVPSRKVSALERSVKRRSFASSRRRNTAGGKPTAEGKTGRHLQASIAGVAT